MKIVLVWFVIIVVMFVVMLVFSMARMAGLADEKMEQLLNTDIVNDIKEAGYEERKDKSYSSEESRGRMCGKQY